MTGNNNPVKKKSLLVKWGLVPILIVLLFFMAKSKSIYEDLFSSWLSVCRIIVHIGDEYGKNEHSGYFYKDVSIFTYGTPPAKLDIHYSSTTHNLLEVQLLRPFKSNNLLEHPWSERKCPPKDNEKFCSDTSEQLDDGYKDIHVYLNNFNQYYSPKFSVKLKDNNDKYLFNAFVRNEVDTNAGSQACKVEEAKWFNYWAWASPFLRLVFVVAFFILIGTLVEAIRYLQNRSTE